MNDYFFTLPQMKLNHSKTTKTMGKTDSNSNSNIKTTWHEHIRSHPGMYTGMLLQQGEAVYLQYRQMLTEKQWRFLTAIAKEGMVIQITAGDFLRKHKIGTPSSAQRLADSLCEKGLLNAETTLHRTEYTVNDVFFSHWLERL